MKSFAFSKHACAVAGCVLLVFTSGCGWSNAKVRNNTQTGVSESGYPGGQAADPGSPALESMRRPEKKGAAEGGKAAEGEKAMSKDEAKEKVETDRKAQKVPK